MDNRNQARCKIECDSIIVFDLELAETIGRIENLSQGGFLLKSDKPLEIDKVFKISMSIPESIAQKSVIRCFARSIWGEVVSNLWETRKDIPEYYWTGFEFLVLDESNTKLVALLADRLGARIRGIDIKAHANSV